MTDHNLPNIWVGDSVEARARFFHRHRHNENILKDKTINYLTLSDKQLYFFLYEENTGNILAAAGLEKSAYEKDMVWLMFLGDHCSHKNKGHNERVAEEVFLFCRHRRLTLRASTYTEKEEPVLPDILRKAAVLSGVTFLESGHHSRNSYNGPFVLNLSPNLPLQKCFIEKTSDLGAIIPQRVFWDQRPSLIEISLPDFLIRQQGDSFYLAYSIAPELASVLTAPERSLPRP